MIRKKYYYNLTFLLVTFSVLIYSTIVIARVNKEIDVNIIYTVKNKSIRKAIKNSLSENLVIKKYNTDLLRLADYSGKQKAIAKLSQAKILIFIDQESLDAIDISKLDGQIITLFHINNEYENRSSIPSNLLEVSLSNNPQKENDILIVTSIEQINNRDKINNLNKILIDTSLISYTEVISAIVQLKI